MSGVVYKYRMMLSPWVIRLIIANVAMYFLTMSSPSLFHLLKLVPAAVPLRPWTPLTYLFLHASPTHLLFNMLGLFFFGPRLEHRLGGRHFIGLYLVSGVAGAALSFFFTPHTSIIGASGAVFGVFLGFARYWPRERVFIWGLLPVESRILVGVMTVLALWGGFGSAGGGIAHFAHLGGFLGGFLYLRWMDWSSPAARFKRKATAPPATAGGRRNWEGIVLDDLHPVNRAEAMRLLEKARREGAGALTGEERAFLDRFAPQ